MSYQPFIYTEPSQIRNISLSTYNPQSLPLSQNSVKQQQSIVGAQTQNSLNNLLDSSKYLNQLNGLDSISQNMNANCSALKEIEGTNLNLQSSYQTTLNSNYLNFGHPPNPSLEQNLSENKNNKDHIPISQVNMFSNGNISPSLYLNSPHTKTATGYSNAHNNQRINSQMNLNGGQVSNLWENSLQNNTNIIKGKDGNLKECSNLWNPNISNTMSQNQIINEHTTSYESNCQLNNYGPLKKQDPPIQSSQQSNYHQISKFPFFKSPHYPSPSSSSQQQQQQQPHSESHQITKQTTSNLLYAKDNSQQVNLQQQYQTQSSPKMISPHQSNIYQSPQSTSQNKFSKINSQPKDVFQNLKKNKKKTNNISVNNLKNTEDISGRNSIPKNHHPIANDSRGVSTNASSAKGSQDYDPKIYTKNEDLLSLSKHNSIPISHLNANMEKVVSSTTSNKFNSHPTNQCILQISLQSSNSSSSKKEIPLQKTYGHTKTTHISSNFLSNDNKLSKSNYISSSNVSAAGNKVKTQPSEQNEQQKRIDIKSSTNLASSPSNNFTHSSKINLSPYNNNNNNNNNKSQISSRSISPSCKTTPQRTSLSPSTILRTSQSNNSNSSPSSSYGAKCTPTANTNLHLFSKMLQCPRTSNSSNSNNKVSNLLTPSTSSSKKQEQPQLNNKSQTIESLTASTSKIKPITKTQGIQISKVSVPQQQNKETNQSNSYQAFSNLHIRSTQITQTLPYSKQQLTSEQTQKQLINQSMNLNSTKLFDDPQKVNAHQNWQQWWNQKINSNLELIKMSKTDNYLECVKLLDKKLGDLKADINYKDDEQNSSIHYAARNGNATLVNLLLFNEVIFDSCNKFQVTPLMLAASEGHDDVVQILINAGADFNLVDENGDSPLHYASRGGHKKIVETLLKKPSLYSFSQNKQGKQAVQLAANEGVIVAFDNFFALQKQLANAHPKVHIHETKLQNIQQMFSKTVETPNNFLILDEQNDLNKIKQTPEYDAKSSSTSDESKNSSVNQEEQKIGPSAFTVHGLIGKGSFGEVYLVEKKSNQMLYAMKVLHKSKIAKHNLTKYAMTERNVMSLTVHPFVVRLNFAFQTSDKLFLIMDYCPGGDLGENLQKEKKFSEDLVKIYLAETVLALEDLHKRDVIFRDLKPDNIVLDYQGHIKLTDFGLSKEGVLDHSTGARSFCGSVAYLAPEMLKRCGHGKAVDWYLLGVVMYELLVGIPPYYASNREELFSNIERAPLKIPSYISNDARSLLKALLQRNPSKRLGSGKGDSEEIKAHPFFSGLNWNEVYLKQLKPPIPNRKIKISKKIDPNLFLETKSVGIKDYIPGWSFVAP